MLKKLNLLFLTFAIFLNCVIVCDAQSKPKAETESDGIVYALNIIEKKNVNKTVTRGDAAGIVLRLLGYDDSIMESGEIFDDVSSDDDNGSAIYTAYKLGIIKGSGTSLYEPDENITYEQFMKMLVTALGYEQRALNLGGYPSGYLLVASQLGLHRDVKIDDLNNLDGKSISQILENALDVEVIASIKGEYAAKNGESLLYTAFRLEKYSGVVTGVYGKAYTPHSYANEIDDLYINDVRYKAQELDTQALAGYYVDFYVEDNQDIVKTVIYAQKSAASEIEIEPENIEEIKIDRKGIYIEYFKSPTSKSSSTEEIYFDNASLIYNGYYTDITKSEKDLFEFSDGSIRLLDYNEDGSYDFLIIERSTTAVIKTYSTTTKTLTFEYPVELGADSVLILDFNDYGRVVFEDTLDYSKLKKGDVLDIRMPKNDMVFEPSIRLGATNRIIRNELTMKESKNGINYIEVDGQLYEFSDDYKNYSSTAFDDLMFGVEYTFYLTESGKIAYIINHLEEERVYGYLTYIDTVSSKNVNMTVYMDDGKFHNFDFAKKVEVYRDGVYVGKKDAEDAISGLLVNGEFDTDKAQLIRFLPDRNTNVILIEFAQNEIGAANAANMYKNGSFVKSRSKYEGYYFHVSQIVYTRAWEPVFAFPSSAVCFTVPDNPEDLDDLDKFSVGGYTAQRGNVILDTYNDNESGVPEIFVNYGGADKYLGFAYNSLMVVVDNVSKGVNANGEICDKLVDVTGKVYYADVADEVFVDKSTKEALKFGDIIQIVKSSGEYVKYIDVLFFADENSPNGYGYTYSAPGTPLRNENDKIIAVGDLDDDRLIASGYIKAIEPNYITIENDAGEEAVFRINSKTIKLYTAYPKRENVVVETVEQLNIGDYVVLKCAQSIIREVVRYFN